MNIVASIDQLALVIFSGIGNACAVLVGNQIGAGEEDRAFRYAARSLSLGAVGGLAVGGVILLARESILSLYKVDPVVIGYAFNVLTIVGVLLWLRASNLILFVGIFRSGGDTRFALILDGVIIWVVGVPCAFLSAFAFHLPVYWVYLSVMSEEFTKWALGMGRLFSRKWIHNLAHTV
jgi:Na+-driven multidrug efflux pump